MAFQGWLIKVGDTDISKYIEINTFIVTPDQRVELDSGRNGLNRLYREVAEHTPTKIEFSTAYLSSYEMTELLQILEKNSIKEIERKIPITYFNILKGNYKTCEGAYVPDYTPKLLAWDGRTLTYDHMRLAFIEY